MITNEKNAIRIVVVLKTTDKQGPAHPTNCKTIPMSLRWHYPDQVLSVKGN
jgi:hypothetical protein